MTPIETWSATIHALCGRIEADHPALGDTLDGIRHNATALAIWQPRAAAYTDPGDGIRSPSLGVGSRPIGSHSDPVGDTAARHADTTDHRRSDTPGANGMAVVDSHRREAIGYLRRALAGQCDDVAGGVRGALSETCDALTAVYRLLPPSGALRQVRAANQGDRGCTCCIRVGAWSATRPGSGLCEWCYRRRALLTALPRRGLIHILRLRHEDEKRVTGRDWDHAARLTPPRRRRR